MLGLSQVNGTLKSMFDQTLRIKNSLAGLTTISDFLVLRRSFKTFILYHLVFLDPLCDDCTWSVCCRVVSSPRRAAGGGCIPSRKKNRTLCIQLSLFTRLSSFLVICFSLLLSTSWQRHVVSHVSSSSLAESSLGLASAKCKSCRTHQQSSCGDGDLGYWWPCCMKSIGLIFG